MGWAAAVCGLPAGLGRAFPMRPACLDPALALLFGTRALFPDEPCALLCTLCCWPAGVRAAGRGCVPRQGRHPWKLCPHRAEGAGRLISGVGSAVFCVLCAALCTVPNHAAGAAPLSGSCLMAAAGRIPLAMCLAGPAGPGVYPAGHWHRRRADGRGGGQECGICRQAAAAAALTLHGRLLHHVLGLL